MKIVNETEYNDTINSGTTLVDFFATWCGPCKALAPILEEVSKEYTDVKFIKVDVDQCENLAGSLGIMSIPTLCIFKDGNLIVKETGYKDGDQLKEFINNNK